MTKSTYYDIIRSPVVTEKSTVANELSKFIFKVDKNATKNLIKKAVTHIFNVKVISVNTILLKGKTKQYKGRQGKRNDFKKAIVTIEKGQTIDIAVEV